MVPRVIRDAAENAWTSASEKASTRANKRSLSSRATLAAVREARNPTAMEASIMTAATPSIFAPIENKYDICKDPMSELN